MADTAGPRHRRTAAPSCTTTDGSTTPKTPTSTSTSSSRSSSRSRSRSSGSSSSSSNSGSSSSLGSVLKAIASALVIVPALSYLIMDGESFTFGYHPAWARWDYWEKPTIRVFTDEQLSLHDGRDPTLPLLLAINGSVFDVSSNPTTYGPGGGYSVFTGADAARGFVTGCFKEDRTWDLRGVEGMFLELDDELDLFESGHWSELVARFGGGDGGYEGKGGEKVGGLREGRKKELRQRAEKRRAAAWEKVVGTINHWDKFFRNHEKYKYVGEVRHRDLSGEPVRSICANALKKRPPKKVE